MPRNNSATVPTFDRLCWSERLTDWNKRLLTIEAETADAFNEWFALPQRNDEQRRQKLAQWFKFKHYQALVNAARELFWKEVQAEERKFNSQWRKLRKQQVLVTRIRKALKSHQPHDALQSLLGELKATENSSTAWPL